MPLQEMPLQDKLDLLKAKFQGTESQPGLFPPEKLAVMTRATDALIESGQALRARHAGDIAPDFTLSDPDGQPVRSRELLARGPLVLTFYRGVWCPYCNLELQALQEALPELQARGAGLVAISPQTPVNSRRAQRENKLGFPILSDAGGQVADAFGIRFPLPDDLVEVYRSFGNDLPLVNADPAWTLPMPARYVIDMDGTIAYAEINPDYAVRPDPSELLPVLDRLRSAKAA